MRKALAMAAALGAWSGLTSVGSGAAVAQDTAGGIARLLRSICVPYFELGAGNVRPGDAVAAQAEAQGFTVDRDGFEDVGDEPATVLVPPAQLFDAGFTEVWLDPAGGECTVLVEELAGERTQEVLADLERWIAERRTGWRFAPLASGQTSSATALPAAEGETAPSHAWQSATHVLVLTRFHQAGLGMSIEVDLRRKPAPAERTTRRRQR